MTEMVIAVFDAASAADAAVQDLEVARIPTAVIRPEIRDNSELRDDSSHRQLSLAHAAGAFPAAPNGLPLVHPVSRPFALQ